jgi:hypothetical protein
VDRRAAVDTYRWSVRNFLPDFAYAEVLLHRKSFPDDLPSPEFDKFEKRLADADFNNGWERYRKTPGLRTHLLAFLIVIVPKIGPAADLAIRGPSQQTEAKYVASVNRTLDRYEELLGQLARDPATDPRVTMNLANLDLDTGYKVKPGSYPLTDQTYAQLVHRLTQLGDPVPERLKQDIEDYYADPSAPITTKKHRKAWERLQAELVRLRSLPVATVRQAE